jgi:hypothetical protein
VAGKSHSFRFSRQFTAREKPGVFELRETLGRTPTKHEVPGMIAPGHPQCKAPVTLKDGRTYFCLEDAGHHWAHSVQILWSEDADGEREYL